MGTQDRKKDSVTHDGGGTESLPGCNRKKGILTSKLQNTTRDPGHHT